MIPDKMDEIVSSIERLADRIGELEKWIKKQDVRPPQRLWDDNDHDFNRRRQPQPQPQPPQPQPTPLPRYSQVNFAHSRRVLNVARA